MYYSKVSKLEEKFKGFKLHHSYRRFNARADLLSTIASVQNPVSDDVFTSNLYEPSIKIKPLEEVSGKVADDQVTPEAQAQGLVVTTNQQD